jgi:RNA polymerase sigma-70 factor (ECF subfamily)
MQPDIIQAVELARGGDSEAIEVVARHALRLALRISAATLGSREEAADIAQDVSIDVLRGLRGLREPARFDAWVHRITARRALRYMRSRRGQARLERSLDELPERDHPLAGVADDGLSPIEPAIRRALAELPPRQRLALALKYVADLTDAEIAAVLGCRRGTAGSLLSRGRTTLHANPLLAELRPSGLQGGN